MITANTLWNAKCALENIVKEELSTFGYNSLYKSFPRTQLFKISKLTKVPNKLALLSHFIQQLYEGR